jgi:hypothetical protein
MAVPASQRGWAEHYSLQTAAWFCTQRVPAIAASAGFALEIEHETGTKKTALGGVRY